MADAAEGQTRTAISADMQKVVGSELSRMVSYPISESDVRKWALAIYYPEEPPARFWDQDAAAGSPAGGIVAPEDFNPFAWLRAQPRGVSRSSAATDADSTERSLGIEGPHLMNQLNGGVSVEYGAPMRPGDVITSVTRLGQYSEREGSLGLMLFTPMETTWTNQGGEMVKRQTLVLIRY
ncbi:MAG: MaoC family dehydratase N-terminal domain-containing protein [Actinomycetota bacterium]|nr:MaoC family dehydratase N-terminal domain-containing protein [Actinomycetota bacterium]